MYIRSVEKTIFIAAGAAYRFDSEALSVHKNNGQQHRKSRYDNTYFF